MGEMPTAEAAVGARNTCRRPCPSTPYGRGGPVVVPFGHRKPEAGAAGRRRDRSTDGVVPRSDRPGGPAGRAAAVGIPTFVRTGRPPEPDDWDEALTKEVVAYAPDLVVSAGFLKLVGPAFLAAFGGRMINTHPALLPSFPGLHGPRDALAYGVKVTGATVFLVDAGVDTGVILAQAAVPVAEDDSVDALHERIKVAERDLLTDITHRLATQAWRVDDRKVTWS